MGDRGLKVSEKEVSVINRLVQSRQPFQILISLSFGPTHIPGFPLLPGLVWLSLFLTH